MKCIVFKKNGELCVIHPAPKCKLSIDEIASKDVPTGSPYKIVDVSELPSRDFRAAWDIDDKELTDGHGA